MSCPPSFEPTTPGDKIMNRMLILLAAVFLVFIGVMSALFVVDEREKVLGLQFGRVVATKEDPGLSFKIPIIQNVVRYDDRILSRDIDPLEVTPLDDRRLVVDAFARYRIIDVNKFREVTGASMTQLFRLQGQDLTVFLVPKPEKF